MCFVKYLQVCSDRNKVKKNNNKLPRGFRHEYRVVETCAELKQMFDVAEKNAHVDESRIYNERGWRAMTSEKASPEASQVSYLH